MREHQLPKAVTYEDVGCRECSELTVRSPQNNAIINHGKQELKQRIWRSNTQRDPERNGETSYRKVRSDSGA